MIEKIVHEATCPVIALLAIKGPRFVNEGVKRSIFAYVLGATPKRSNPHSTSSSAASPSTMAWVVEGNADRGGECVGVGWMPLWSMRVAWLWRRSWMRMWGRLFCLTKRRQPEERLSLAL